ncbi:MAG: 30S ribosomal protein S2 [Candidatus Saccharimonadales bacterium]
MATDVDITKLLEAGAHFGHKSSRWHPKMAQYIHSKRDGNHIIDLTKTVVELDRALNFIQDVASQGKQVMLVGTKRQAKDIVKTTAVELNMPYVTERWLGGMLTNRNTMGGRIKHLKELEAKMESGALAAKYGKLEVQRYQEEIDDMNHIYGGIKELAPKLGAIFITDILTEDNAVREARKLGVPIIAIVDTNADPSLIDFPIPANDDAVKTIELITSYVKSAIMAGQAKVKKVEVDKDQAPQPAKAEAIAAEAK